MVDSAELASDSGLACAGIACEDAVVDLFLAVTEPPAAALLEESRLIGHRLYALLHIVESDHLTQFAHALLERRALAGEFVEGDVFLLKQRGLVIRHEGNGALEEPWSHLLGNETPDIVARPAGKCTLFPALDDGACEAVLRGGGGCEIADEKFAVEDLHEVEGGIGLLLNHALGVEESSQRGELFHQLVGLLP